MCFSCFCHSKYHKSIMPPLQCDFLEDVYFFLWSSIFSIYLLPADIWEESEKTWQLIKFYLIENMKGDRGNWLALFKFPFLSILWSFLLSYDKVYSFPLFTVFCSSVCFPNNLNYCCQQMQGAYKMCTVINTLIPESD